MVDIRFYKDEAEAASRAGKALSAELFRLKDVPVLLLLSGGSAFGMLKTVRKDFLPSNLMVGMLDERYSADPAVNNFAQFLATEFYTTAGAQGAFFLDSRVDPAEETLAEYADGLEAALRDWKRDNPKGRIVITQGMGADGHTAGVMPHPEDSASFSVGFDDATTWVLGYDAGNKNKYRERATVTLPFLRDCVDFSLMYVAGDDKKPALLRALAKDGTLAETPARIIQEMKNVTLVTTIDQYET